MSRFRTFSDALKEKYGEKVYKVPVALARTCPNRGWPYIGRRMYFLRQYRGRIRKKGRCSGERTAVGGNFAYRA